MATPKRASPLRVVANNEQPAVKAKALDVATAAKSGDRLDLLVAMRDRIAKAVSDESCPPRDLASLTKRLDDIADKISMLQAAAEKEGEYGDVADEAFDASAI